MSALDDHAGDRGLYYRQGWTFKEWMDLPVAKEEQGHNLLMAVLFPEHAVTYARRALKWGASSERVAAALAGVAA